MSKIYKALADFQQEVQVIHKDTQGYGYSYADLPAIFEVINPLLKKHKLGFTQLLNGTSLETIIFHVEDDSKTLNSTIDIPQGVQLAKMNEFQVMGSALTYLRRYSLSAALGLVTDVDNDASGGQTNIPEKQKTDDLPWFNQNTEEWEGALKKGSSIELLRKHFKISKANAEEYEKQLNKK